MSLHHIRDWKRDKVLLFLFAFFTESRLFFYCSEVVKVL